MPYFKAKMHQIWGRDKTYIPWDGAMSNPTDEGHSTPPDTIARLEKY